MRVQNSLLGSSIEWDDPVPTWVHMAEVPPPVDERIPDVAAGQRIYCPHCPAVMAGVGILEHNADGSHSWTPTRTLPRWAGWIPAIVLLVIVAAVVAWRVAS